MSIIGQIDVEEYKWGDGGTYIIMGWAVSEKKESVASTGHRPPVCDTSKA